MTVKFCKKCQIETERTKCGRCKPCHRASVDKYQAANREKIKIARAMRYANDPEKIRARSSKWRAENPEKARAAVHKWRVNNPDYQSNWRSENPEKVRASKIKYKAENPEDVLTAHTKYRTSNLEKYRIYQQNRRARANGGKLSNGLTEKLFELQRGKCACGCKQPLGDDYHMDHIMPLALGGPNTDGNMQLLTAKCNRQKNAKHPVDFMQQRGFLL